MKFKHFFLLLVLIAIFFIVVYWITINYNLLVKQDFYFTKKIAVPTWLAIFLFFLAGFFLMGILFLIDAWKKTIKIHKLQIDREEKIAIGEGVEISVYNMLYGEIEEAKKVLEKYSNEKLGVFENKILRLCIALREKDLGLSELLIKDLELQTSSPLIPLMKAKYFEIKEENEKAIAILKEKIKDISPNLKKLTIKNLRNLYLKIKNFEEAIKLQEEILKEFPSEEEKKLKICFLYELAKLLKENNKEKEALHKIQEILKESPKFTPAWVLYGDIYKEDNEEEKAISVYTEGFKNTYSAILLHKIENLFLEKEEAAKALETINHIRFQVEKDTIPKFFLGRLYYRLEMIDEAYKFLSSLQPFAPNSIVLNFLLGSLEERLGKSEKSLNSYKKALEKYDAVVNEYYCFNCGKSLKEWRDRCPHCEAWASIELNFKEEISEDLIGLKITPISYPLF